MVRRQSKSLSAGRSVSRRVALRAGAIGLLGGIGMPHLSALRALAQGVSPDSARRSPKAKSVIYIFLSGGLSQIDSFDPKPDAKSDFRGPFRSIPTRTPGISICEHLPMLAERSEKWALVRSLTHPYNEHSQGHLVMLSGRTEMPPGFDPSRPRRTDWPALASIVNEAVRSESALPPSMVLPERLVHRTGRVIPGQFGGLMGPQRDPWFIEAAPFSASQYGAYPEYSFHHQRGAEKYSSERFDIPEISLCEGLTQTRFHRRLEILRSLERQQRELESAVPKARFGRFHEKAIDLLTDSKTRRAFDIASVDPATLDRYGRNSFGWSLLTARQLVETGVRLVQVNLGNNESWDTHTNAFYNLENFLLPPTDRALSALLDDLDDRGLLKETLILMAGEFGRTPRIFSIGPGHPPGRDHWGAVQTVFFAGGGVRGGAVIGSSDKDGAHPKNLPQKPENMAATVFDALGIHRGAHWTDQGGRPHLIYQADPIPGLV